MSKYVKLKKVKRLLLASRARKAPVSGVPVKTSVRHVTLVHPYWLAAEATALRERLLKARAAVRLSVNSHDVTLST